MPVGTIEDAKELIQNWLNDRAFPISYMPLSDDFSFQFGRLSPLGVVFGVLQPKNLKRGVIVVTKIEFHPFHIKQIESMPSKDRDEFLWDLRKDLFFGSPAFIFDNPVTPRSIQFTQQISFDELTEGKISDAVDQTVRCVVWVAWSLGRKFGVPTGE